MFLWDLNLFELFKGHNVEFKHCANKKLRLVSYLRKKTHMPILYSDHLKRINHSSGVERNVKRKINIRSIFV